MEIISRSLTWTYARPLSRQPPVRAGSPLILPFFLVYSFFFYLFLVYLLNTYYVPSTEL